MSEPTVKELLWSYDWESGHWAARWKGAKAPHWWNTQELDSSDESMQIAIEEYIAQEGANQ